MFFPYKNVFSLVGIAAIVFVLCMGCGSDPGAIDEEKKPFRQYHTHELAAHDGLVYAATDSGLYRKPVDPSSDEWASLGLAEATVWAMAVFSEQELLASISFSEGTRKNTIAKTTDGGETWFSWQNNFGGKKGITPKALEISSGNPDILYARGIYNVAKSVDRGQSWKSVFSTWDGFGTAKFVKVDPNSPQTVYAGGSNAIFQPHLIRSKNGGLDWVNLNDGLQIFENTIFEADANDIVINKQQGNKLLLALDVGIFYSENQGTSWDSVYTGASIQTFANSSFSDEIVYASGGNRTGTPFYLKSTDFGDTWQEFEIPGAPSGLWVNDMVAVEEGGVEILYFATNRGVYSYIPE